MTSSTPVCNTSPTCVSLTSTCWTDFSRDLCQTIRRTTMVKQAKTNKNNHFSLFRLYPVDVSAEHGPPVPAGHLQHAQRGGDVRAALQPQPQTQHPVLGGGARVTEPRGLSQSFFRANRQKLFLISVSCFCTD